MKKNILIAILVFLIFWITYATVTTANLRKSSKLPWQWTLSSYYDNAHNVWLSNVSESRFEIYTWSLSLNWVTYDRITWLYWEISPNNTFCKSLDTNNFADTNCNNWSSWDACNWCAAKLYCENLILWWFNDWRLPNRQELFSIFDFSSSNTFKIDSNFFTTANVNIFKFWTSDFSKLSPQYAYSIDLKNIIIEYRYKNSDNYWRRDTVRCVR